MTFYRAWGIIARMECLGEVDVVEVEECMELSMVALLHCTAVLVGDMVKLAE